LYEGEPPLTQGKHRSKTTSARPPSARLSSRMIALNRRLGDLLRSRREERGLSQAELADRSGMDVGEIAEIEVGASTLSFLSACVLSRAMEMAPSRLALQLEKAIAGKTSEPVGRKSP
jgi:ribosome-binding protein aMBF1 (putative translation factor)